MLRSLKKKKVLFICIPFFASILFCGCTTKSQKVVGNLDVTSPAFNSLECQRSINDIEFHSDVKKAKIIAVPTAVIMSGGLLIIPTIVASAGLNALDEIDAFNINSRCGGELIEKKTIQKNISKDLILESVTIIPMF